MPYGQPAAPPPAKKSKTTIILVVVGALLLCCLLVTIGGFLFFNNLDLGDLGEAARSSSDTTAPGSMVTDDRGLVGEAGDVAVWLSWDEPVDMDLELWGASGEEFLGSAYLYAGDDITVGGAGDEYFEFRAYDVEDFSTGRYVVSVYFAGLDPSGTRDSAYVTLTVQDRDGRVQTFKKTVLWEPGYDQWHAVEIDAVTGAVTPLDEWN